MDRIRRLRIAAAIADAARAEGPPVRLHHVCRAAVAVVGVSGASLSVLGDLGFGEIVCATDTISEQAAELQTLLGVGPAIDALHGHLVLASGMSRPTYRWPRLDAAMSQLGVAALFAFPVAMSDITVGVLELYRMLPGTLNPHEVADAELFAQAALDLLNNTGMSELGHTNDAPLGPMDAQWAVINQAVGAVSAQLNSGLSEAYLRLRAYAYLSDRRLLATAEDVLAGKLRFSPDNQGKRP